MRTITIWMSMMTAIKWCTTAIRISIFIFIIIIIIFLVIQLFWHEWTRLSPVHLHIKHQICHYLIQWQYQWLVQPFGTQTLDGIHEFWRWFSCDQINWQISIFIFLMFINNIFWSLRVMVIFAVINWMDHNWTVFWLISCKLKVRKSFINFILF